MQTYLGKPEREIDQARIQTSGRQGRRQALNGHALSNRKGLVRPAPRAGPGCSETAVRNSRLRLAFNDCFGDNDRDATMCVPLV